MNSVYCVDMQFEARQVIKSLPPFHGARWSAWLRFACFQAALRMEDIVYALLPLRHGTARITPGECLMLRLLVPPNALPVLPRMVRAMLEMPPRGEFCGRSLHFVGFREGIDGTPLITSELTPQTVLPLTAARLADRIVVAQQWERWSVRFSAPLRLTLPAGEKKGADGVRRFCDARFFRQDGALSHMLQHVRLLAPAVCGTDIRLQDVRLRWEDMRYNRERTVALGGVIGEICAAGHPDAETARRLVLGEYLGAGKNGRFGLGFWRLFGPDASPLRENGNT